MFRRALLGVVIGWGCSAVLSAQEFQQPGPEHKRLAELAGTWDAVMDVQGQKFKATAVYKVICGGMWVVNDFEGDLFGQKYHGHGLDGYDQHKKKYVGIWTQSVESAPMFMEGTFDEKSKTLTLAGESAGPDGKPQKFKSTSVLKDADHFSFKMFMIDAAGQEQLGFTIDYTRRK